MSSKIKSIVLQTFVTSVFCFTVGTAQALVVKGVVVESGGTASSTTGTTVMCIGGPVSGKYSSVSFSGSSGCTPDPAGIDTDGDSMRDSWEDLYTLLKYDATDRYADSDSDGSSNARERAQGTIPKGTGTACPGFSTTTITDADCDGVTDSDDPDPDNASVTTLTVDGTYKGGKLQSADSAR